MCVVGKSPLHTWVGPMSPTILEVFSDHPKPMETEVVAGAMTPVGPALRDGSRDIG